MDPDTGRSSVTPPTSPPSRAALPPGWRLVVFSAACALWITLDVLWRGPWTRLDAHVSSAVLDLGLRHAPWPKNAVYILTMFGGRVPIVVVTGCFIVAVGLARRTLQPLLRIAAALGLLTLVIYAFKWGVGRTAPVVDALHAGGTSYPSGHVPNAILMWGVMAWLAVDYRLGRYWIRLFGVLRFLGPCLAAAGMLLLDWHWLSDLVAGAAFGIVLLAVLHVVFDGPIGRWGDLRPRSRAAASPDRNRPTEREPTGSEPMAGG